MPVERRGTGLGEEIAAAASPEHSGKLETLYGDLKRLERIRAQYEAGDGSAPAWLVTLGIEDLRAEERLIQKEIEAEGEKRMKKYHWQLVSGLPDSFVGGIGETPLRVTVAAWLVNPDGAIECKVSRAEDGDWIMSRRCFPSFPSWTYATLEAAQAAAEKALGLEVGSVEVRKAQ